MNSIKDLEINDTDYIEFAIISDFCGAGCPPKPDFYNYLSAYKNLEILGKISGQQVTKQRIMQMLDIVGLEKRYKSIARHDIRRFHVQSILHH